MIPLRDTIRSRHFPFVNWLILIANALVFILMLTMSARDVNRFVELFAIVPANWAINPIWYLITLFTSMFLHGGWWHFLSNMWTLYIFGDNVEDRMGPIGYLIFYIISGLIAGLLQTLIAPGSHIPVLGASGAIAGVLGAYMFLFPRARVVTLIPIIIIWTTIRIPAVLYLGFWFISQLFSGLASIGSVVSGGVAWWAHIGGFLFGLSFGRMFLWRKQPPRVYDYPQFSLPPEDSP